MVMASSGNPICLARIRRLWNGTFGAPDTVIWPFTASHSASRPRVSMVTAGKRFPPKRPGRQRCCAVDRADAVMRNVAAQDRGVQRVRARHVINELPAAAQKAQVFEAFDRAADGAV